MRSFVSSLLFVFLAFSLFATDYFSQGSLNVNLTTSWRDSGGNYPPNFTTAGNRFIVQYGHNMTASAQWTVSGTNSYVVVQNNGKITTGLFNHQITGTVQNGGTYEVTNTSYSGLGWGGPGLLETTSNFILNNASINFIDTISYGNLTVQNGSADVRGGATGFEVKGELKVTGNGAFSGGLSEDQTLSIANIRVENNGNFYGSEGSAVVTYNVSGNVTCAGGYFFGSEGSGNCNYNITGNLLISGGFFYGVFRSSSSLPYNSYTIGGNFTKTGGSYYAVNIVNGGHPTIYLTGSGKSLGLGDVTNSFQAHHNIYVQSGASYTLSNLIPFDSYMQFLIYGTLIASTYQIKPVALNCTFHIYGTLKTASTYGLSGTADTTIPSTYAPAIDVGSNSTVEFNASSTQTLTGRTDYRTVVLTGGTKNLSANATIATQMTANADLDINNTITLTLNGLLSALQLIHGLGSIYIGGSAAQLQLPACNVQTITLNRINGCAQAGDVTVTSLVLTSGTFAIADRMLTLSGLITAGAGSITGGAAATLYVSGTAATLQLPASISSLHTLLVGRSNGCTLQGSLDVTDLYLSSGAFSVGMWTLTMHGALYSGLGTLNTTTSSTLSIQAGSVDINIPTLILGSLVINRVGWSCNMGGSVNSSNLSLNGGNLSIGANTLFITATLMSSGGTLTGGLTSQLRLGVGVLAATIPSVTLLSYTQSCAATVSLTGPMYVNEVALVNGILNLGDTYIWIYTGFAGGTITPYTGVITGSGSSGLYMSADNPLAWEIPQATVGTLYCDLTGGCIMDGAVQVLSNLYLNNGAVNPNSQLHIANGSTIFRNAGHLTAVPELGYNLNIQYGMTNLTGYELSDQPGYVNSIMVLGFQSTVTAQHDVYLSQRINIMPECTFDISDFQLICQPFVQFEGMGYLFGNVQIDIGPLGINAPPAGLRIQPGIQIDNFHFTHLPQVQQLNSVQGILRTWRLYGDFDGELAITFSWMPSADNGIVFSHQNPAYIYRWSGDFWQQIDDPVDVSMFIPRSITVTHNEFSLWTAGPLAPLAVPFVLDFEDGWKQCSVVNGGQLNKWVTGTDVAYRNTHAAYISTDGSTNWYDVNLPTIVHFYLDVKFPDDMTDVRLRFNWKGGGEQNQDYMCIHLSDCLFVPMEGMPAAGQPLGVLYCNVPDGELVTIPIDSEYAGLTKRLIFSWHNNFLGGEQPPAAIDNIRIVPEYPEQAVPQNLFAHQDGDDAIITWDLVPGANDYQIECADTYEGEYNFLGTSGNPAFYYPAVTQKMFFRVKATD